MWLWHILYICIVNVRLSLRSLVLKPLQYFPDCHNIGNTSRVWRENFNLNSLWTCVILFRSLNFYVIYFYWSSLKGELLIDCHLFMIQIFLHIWMFFICAVWWLKIRKKLRIFTNFTKISQLCGNIDALILMIPLIYQFIQTFVLVSLLLYHTVSLKIRKEIVWI